MSEVVEAPARPTGRNYVGGEWRPAASGETYEKRNPMRPSELVGEFSSSSEADADAAVAAAEAAFAEWSALPLAKRASYLNAAASSLESRAEQVARDMTAEMGKPLRESRGETARAARVRDPRVRAISFTGSVATGSSVRDEATKLGKRVQLELGGQNPLIVMADADLVRAAEAAYAGAFWSAGQKCTATRRIYVQEPVYDEFRQRLLERIARGKVGDPTDPETEVGPIVNEKQFDEILDAIERGRGEGGEVIAGGA